MFLDTRNKNMYRLGVGISMIFKILGHFLFKGDGSIPYGHDLYICKNIYHPKFLDTRNKNIYGLGVGISAVFKILRQFQGGWNHTVWS
jgi:hypothetical protein